MLEDMKSTSSPVSNSQQQETVGFRKEMGQNLDLGQGQTADKTQGLGHVQSLDQRSGLTQGQGFGQIQGESLDQGQRQTGQQYLDQESSQLSQRYEKQKGMTSHLMTQEHDMSQVYIRQTRCCLVNVSVL